MCPLKPLLIPLFEGEVPILLITRSLLLKMLLSHHVQLSARGQLCVARRLLPDFLSDPISCPFFRGSAMSRAMSVERRHAAYDERRERHQDKKTKRLEFSWHDFGNSQS